MPRPLPPGETTRMSPPPPRWGATFEKRRFDRRRHDRFPAAGYPLVLGWWDGPGFRITTAALRDISRSGAAALADEPPPASVPVCLFPEGLSSPERFAARVVAVVGDDAGPALVRLQFSKPCPDAFLKAVAG